MSARSFDVVAFQVALACGAAACAGCSYVPPPETAFRAKTAPVDVEIEGGGLAVGGRVRAGATELEVVDVSAARRDDELVSASVRAALDDASLAAAAASVVAKAAKEEDGAKVADRASQVLAVASVLGSLVAASDEKSEAFLRSKVGDRMYRATCTSTEERALLDPYARPSLSCAIVPVVESPSRHWALVVRTTKRGVTEAPRQEGFVEARTAKGRDDSAPILRIYTRDSYATGTNANGKEETYTQFNASFEIVTPQTRVASITTRSYGAKPQAWLDTSGLADAEARDVASVTAAILQLYRWPEVDNRTK